jgi:hypothetical protein
LWGRMRCHALVPFPVFENGENRMTGRDFVRNLGLMSKRRQVCPFPYGIENRFRGTLNALPTLELSCLLTCHTDDRRMLVERLRELELPRTFIGEVANEPGDVERLIALGAVDGASRRDVELGQNLRYYDRIRCSRRCISVPGRGFDTLRFWEILGQGALLISKRIAIEMSHPPIEGEHYLAFDSWSELEDVLQTSFRSPDAADEIRSKGHAFALRFHTTRARALYFLSTLVERGLVPARQLVESGIPDGARS